MRTRLLDAENGLLRLSLAGKNAPHRDGLGYAFRDRFGRIRLFRFGPQALSGGGIPGPVEEEATLLLAHARKASPEFAKKGALFAHPLPYAGILLCHNGTVRDRLGMGFGTDSQQLLFWLDRAWRPRTAERLAQCLVELLSGLRDYSAVNLILSEGENLFALCAYTADPEYFTLWFRQEKTAVAVASEPGKEGWEPLANWELLSVSPDLAVVRRRLR